MMVQMALLQLISGDTQGLPSNNSLVAVLVIYSLAVGAGFFEKVGDPTFNQNKFNNHRRRDTLIPYPELDAWPKNAISLFFVYLVVNMIVADPERAVSTGVHQTVGPCGVRALDLAGQEREIYLCPETHSQDFTFLCQGKDVTPDATAATTEWYTVCGKPHERFSHLLAAVALLGMVGIATYRTAFHVETKLRTGKKSN